MRHARDLDDFVVEVDSAMTAGGDRFSSIGTLDVVNGRATMTAEEGSATTLLAR